MMEYNLLDVALGALISAIVVSVFHWYLHRQSQRTIDLQQDTIQKLINREPVTYAETGTQPQKKSTERYAAWGAQMVNIDEEESRS